MNKDLSKLALLIESQEKHLESLKPALEIAQHAKARAEIAMIESAVESVRTSERERSCTEPEESKRRALIVSIAQIDRDNAQYAKQIYQEAERKYIKHWANYNEEKAKLQKLKTQYHLFSGLLSSQRFLNSNQSEILPEKLETAQDDFLNSRFSLPTMSKTNG